MPKRIASLPGFILISILFLVFNSVSLGQGQTVFFEDFETGDPLQEGWTVTGIPEILWHIAEDGECLAETRMAAYNHGPFVCGYHTKGPNTGRLKSPVFTLTGQPPYTLSFRIIRQVDPPNTEGSCVFLVNADEPGGVALGCFTDNSGDPMEFVGEVQGSPEWEGRNARIEFEFTGDQYDNDNPGWLVDNVELRNSSPEGPVPTVSEWGLVVMTLVLLTAGTVLFRRAGSARRNWSRS